LKFEKTTEVAAPAERVWQMLLDPQLMGTCVPGIEAIDVISDVEYLVNVQVKIAFVSARFKVRTKIAEARQPSYLRSDGVGEDSSLTSSLKLSSELFLDRRDDGTTGLRMLLDVDLFGRLGTFGLNIIKTKADRMWEEFSRNLAAKAGA
jgi:carbon monoxide dehydrogenase subunit G